MNKPPQIPLSSIVVGNRQRIDLGDLSDLKESMRLHGLIQPIILNQDNVLIAGGRRLACAQQLGWETIPFCYRETLSEDELHILELEENLRRKDESWQERVLHIAHIHQLKSRLAGADGDRWTQKMTGEMLGITDAHVNYNLTMAALLRAELDEPTNTVLPSARFWKCDNFAEAWRLRLRDYEDARMKLLATELAQQSTKDSNEPDLFSEFATPATSTIPVEDDEVVDGFSRNDSWKQFAAANGATPESKEQFTANWSRFKEARAAKNNTIRISHRLICGDSIAYMNDPANAGRFDHVITDIPYGIDMDNITQLNPSDGKGGMVDLDTVEKEHDVEYNRDLITKFFPAAFTCTNDKAFVITWCDQMLWQYMYDLATKAGFRVQRWPITWFKTSPCLNQCAHYNFTKNTEIAIVCRKPGATLRSPQSTCSIVASRDELCDKIDHPFAKPFAVWEFLADAVSMEGQEILEPFAGRGSGVLSMLRMKRNVTAVEMNENHFSRLVQNVKDHYLTLNKDFIFK